MQRVCVVMVACALFGLSERASAQCSTADVDPVDGVPDDCPAGSNYIAGTSGNDDITGTNGADCIYGFDGKDTIDARKGDDYVCGGDGDDDIESSDGANALYGEGGKDTITGGKADDTIVGGDGNDELNGGRGNDTISGGDGDDDLIGDRGNDVLNGDAGEDTLDGGNNDDTLNGGDGDDELTGGSGDDLLNGDAGEDTLDGDNGADTLNGGDDDDELNGGNQDDTLNGGAGDDELNGEGGSDILNGDAGSDTINGGDQGDTIDGGDGDDDLNGDGGADIISGGDGNDTLNGGTQSDNLWGGDGDDDLFGEDGGDALSGGNGTDNLDGGAGNDTCVEEVPGTSERLTDCQTITYAAISDFSASPSRQGVLVQWRTSTEAGTAGFDLLREGPRPGTWQHVGRVAASPEGSPFGAKYSVPDPGANPRAGHAYRLEEITTSGDTLRYGPFWVAPARSASRSMPEVGKLARRPNEVSLVRREASSMRSSRRARKGVEGDAPDAVLITIDTPGVVRVTAQELASTLKVDASSIENAIENGNVALRSEGRDIGWHAVNDDQALQFVARATDSPFLASAVHVLRLEPGLRMPQAELQTSAPEAPHTFTSTIRREQDVFAGTVAAPDPRGDIFFWKALIGGDPAYDAVTVDVDTPKAIEGTSLVLELYAATQLGPRPHHVEAWWNDVLVGEVALLGRTAHRVALPLDELLLLETNTLTLRATTTEELSIVYLDAVEVAYVRPASFEGETARFSASSTGANTIDGFGEAEAHLYDMDDPDRPTWLGLLPMDAGENGFGVAFEGAGEFVASTVADLRSPTELIPFHEVELRSTEQEADYVIITAAPFWEGAQRLAEWRAQDGYKPVVIDVMDIFFEFGNAEPDPLAIREFLRFAAANWQSPPRFVVLVGKGSLDYRNVLGLGGNWVPAALAETPGGLYGSDNLLADLSGDDGLPEVAIGRLPVSTPEELTIVLDAIAEHESSLEKGTVVLATDRSALEEFRAATNALDRWLGDRTVTQIDLNTLDTETAREQLFGLWSSDVRWINYIGHGGLDRLSDLGLVLSSDTSDLAQGSSRPIVAAWTCNIARFEVPGFTSVAERLVIDGAAAAVIGSTGWSNHHETDELREGFFAEAFASETETLGEAFMLAQRRVKSARLEQRRVYLLFGDPALRIREKATTEPTPRTQPRSSGSGCGIAHYDRVPAVLLLPLLFALRRRR